MTTDITKNDLVQTIEAGILAVQGGADAAWKGATDALIELFAHKGVPFSSGELAAHLRTVRPDLRFSVTNSVGEHLRSRFHADTLWHRDDQGDEVPLVQVPRVTEGWSRTPPGQSVFVYAINRAEGELHPFEVDIPTPGVPVKVEPDGLPAIPAQPATPQPHFIKLAPRKAISGLTAKVHTDSRLVIPRNAFEELLHATGAALSGGDSVYVVVDDTAQEVRLALAPAPGFKSYSLQKARGRVLVSHPTRPFVPGSSFSVFVRGDELVVNLT